MEGSDIVNNGLWIAMAPNGATLIFTRDSIITGTGTIDLQECLSFLITNNGATVTLGPYQNIHGAKNLVMENGYFINQGSITQYGVNPMTINPGFAEIINQGFITATGTGGINFENGLITNTGTIQANSSSKMSLLNMKITGGNLGALGNGKIWYHYNTFLRDVNIYGSGIVPTNTHITFADTITNTGQIFISQTYITTGSSSIITVGDKSIITGAGKIDVPDDPSFIFRCPGIFTQTYPHTIRGAGYLLNGSGGKTGTELYQ